MTRPHGKWHIRRDEVEDFAEWAFGPDGLPELLVLAYGDFAFRDRFKKENTLYCRSDALARGDNVPNFRALEPSDRQLWDWVQDNMETLSACPYRALMLP